MAKESVKARQRKREKMVAQYAEKREALKEAGDYKGLDLLPKNASPVRLRTVASYRPATWIYEVFRVSRNMFRDMALQGKIPGVKKASW